MDSPASSRGGRGRSSTRKRHALPSSGAASRRLSASSEQFADVATASMTSSAPIPAHPPSTATPAGDMPSSHVALETPSPTASRSVRATTKRGSRQTEKTAQSPEEPGSRTGRSLRKKARIDYSFLQAEDDDALPARATPAGARSQRKRRADQAFEDEDIEDDTAASRPPKRHVSEQPMSAAASRRRKPASARKSIVEPPSDMVDAQLEDALMDDVEVQDTIEVGGHHSDISDSSPQRRASTGSSHPHINLTPQVPFSATSASGLRNHVDNDDEAVVLGSSPTIAPARRKANPRPLVPDADTLEERLTPWIPGKIEWYPKEDPDPEADPEVGADEVTPLEEAAEAPAEDNTPATSPGPMDSRAVSPAPEPEAAGVPPPAEKKRFAFRQARPVEEFTELFKDIKSLPTPELYRRLEIANRALVAWQQEYNKAKKVVDDEENSVAYQAHENSFANRFRLAVSRDPAANPVETKPFVPKGYKAPKPDSDILYMRQQDKIMAQAYGFEYDGRDSMIGKQDPIAQRIGGSKARLRDRPRQSAKAAEADDPNIVHSKRVRKPPPIFDGIVDSASRSSTPVPARGRRRKGLGGEAEDDIDVPVPALNGIQIPQNESPPKKKGKGGRPPKHRKSQIPPAIPEHAPTSSATLDSSQEMTQVGEVEKPPTRKRGRKSNKEIAAEKAAAAEAERAEKEDMFRPGLPPRQNSRLSEVPTSSFYSGQSIPSAAPGDDSRPPTSSSTATVDTMASNNYQLREKRQRKFSLNDAEHDAEHDDEFQQPQQPQPQPQDQQLQDQQQDQEQHQKPRPKRVRRAPQKIRNEDLSQIPAAPTPDPKPQAPEPASAPPKQTKIKLKNWNPPPAVNIAPTLSNTPSLAPSSDATPPPTGASAGSNGTKFESDVDPNKDYNSMTKSEKMSHSMKARWSSGSMTQAVAKRRATLAAKKQATTAAPPGPPATATAPSTPSGTSMPPLANHHFPNGSSHTPF